MNNMYLKNVATLSLNQNICIGCGLCIDVCPHGVFELRGDRAEIIDKDACMECGACANNCPVSAIEVKRGTGCALAIISGRLKGTEPNCSCSDEDQGCC